MPYKKVSKPVSKQQNQKKQISEEEKDESIWNKIESLKEEVDPEELPMTEQYQNIVTNITNINTYLEKQISDHQ